MSTQRRIYRGCDFESWNNQQACFWVAPSALRLAAPSKSEALADACVASDQSLGPCHGCDVIGFDPEVHGP